MPLRDLLEQVIELGQLILRRRPPSAHHTSPLGIVGERLQQRRKIGIKVSRFRRPRVGVEKIGSGFREEGGQSGGLRRDGETLNQIRDVVKQKDRTERGPLLRIREHREGRGDSGDHVILQMIESRPFRKAPRRDKLTHVMLNDEPLVSFAELGSFSRLNPFSHLPVPVSKSQQRRADCILHLG
jgi:hypothetical protein